MDIPKYRTKENCCGCFIWFLRGRTWRKKKKVGKEKVERDVAHCEGDGFHTSADVLPQVGPESERGLSTWPHPFRFLSRFLLAGMSYLVLVD